MGIRWNLQPLSVSCQKSPRGIFLGCSFYLTNVLPWAVPQALCCWSSSKHMQTTGIYLEWGEMAFCLLFYGVSEALWLPRCGEQECWFCQGGQQPIFCQRHLFAGAPVPLGPRACCGGARGDKKGLVCMLHFINSMQWLNCLLGRSCWKTCSHIFKALVSGRRAEE